APRRLHSFPTRRSSDLGVGAAATGLGSEVVLRDVARDGKEPGAPVRVRGKGPVGAVGAQEGLLGEIVRLAGPEGGPQEVAIDLRSEEHTSELQSLAYLV